MDNRSENYEQYKELAYAIILKAVEDYEEALAVLRVDEPMTDYDNNDMLENCERFFKSAWFSQLANSSDITGDIIIEKCKKRVEDARQYIYDEKKDAYLCPECGKHIRRTLIERWCNPIYRCGNCRNIVWLYNDNMRESIKRRTHIKLIIKDSGLRKGDIAKALKISAENLSGRLNSSYFYITEEEYNHMVNVINDMVVEKRKKLLYNQNEKEV